MDPMHLLIPYSAPLGPACRQALDSLRLPHLQALLRRLAPAQRLSGSAHDCTPLHERVLAQSMGLDAADGLIPWAALDADRLGLCSLHGYDAWAWITPCHWEVHSHHVQMADPRHLALTPADADALRQSMHPYFAEDGITLFAHPLGHAYLRWLAHGAVFRDLPTASLDRVAGQSVGSWMPAQEQAKALRRLQNEMQMLLYTHPVNDARYGFKLPHVNSFWVSGTGTLPPDQALQAEQRTAKACARRESLRDAALGDDARLWCQAWEDIDATTLAQLLRRLEAREDVRLTLSGDSLACSFESRPAPLWTRWARRLRAPSVQQLLQTL